MEKKTFLPITIVLIWLLPYTITLIVSSVFMLNPLNGLIINELGLVSGVLLTYAVHKDLITLPDIRVNVKNTTPALLISVFTFSISFASIVLYLAFRDGEYFEYSEQINLYTVLEPVHIKLLHSDKKYNIINI